MFLLNLQGCDESDYGDPGKKKAAADFSLDLFDGERFQLSNHKGKPVFINFWASWCVPCAEEMPAIEKVYKEYKSKGVVFVGIAVNDTETKAGEFAEKFEVTFPVGLDEAGDIREAYGIYGVPTSLFVSKDGRTNYVHVGRVTEDLLRHELDKLL